MSGAKQPERPATPEDAGNDEADAVGGNAGGGEPLLPCAGLNGGLGSG